MTKKIPRKKTYKEILIKKSIMNAKDQLYFFRDRLKQNKEENSFVGVLIKNPKKRANIDLTNPNLKLGYIELSDDEPIAHLRIELISTIGESRIFVVKKIERRKSQLFFLIIKEKLLVGFFDLGPRESEYLFIIFNKSKMEKTLDDVSKLVTIGIEEQLAEYSPLIWSTFHDKIVPHHHKH